MHAKQVCHRATLPSLVIFNILIYWKPVLKPTLLDLAVSA
jgi:hypothetical protein